MTMIIAAMMITTIIRITAITAPIIGPILAGLSVGTASSIRIAVSVRRKQDEITSKMGALSEF